MKGSRYRSAVTGRFVEAARAFAAPGRTVKETRYPYRDGGVIVLGPELFASEDKTVISWRGESYYRYDAEPPVDTDVEGDIV